MSAAPPSTLPVAMFLRPRNVGDRATVAPMPLKTRFTPSRSHLRGPAIADLCRFLRAIRTTSPCDAPACTSGIDAAFDASPCSADTSSGGPYPAYGDRKIVLRHNDWFSVHLYSTARRSTCRGSRGRRRRPDGTPSASGRERRSGGPSDRIRRSLAQLLEERVRRLLLLGWRTDADL